MKKTIVEIIARGVLIHRGKLLVCRNRKHGHLFLPGGHVEFGESAGKALEREMMEEAGVPLLAGRFLGGCEAHFRQGSKRGLHHEVNLVFELRVASGKRSGKKRGGGRGFHVERIASRESKIEFVWLPLAEVVSGRSERVVLPRGVVGILAGGGGWVSDWPA